MPTEHVGPRISPRLVSHRFDPSTKKHSASMTKKLSISLIMPTFNKSYYLDLTLSALRRVDFKDFEVVLVDDGSTDRTPEIAKKHREHLSLNYLRQENRGRAAARNTAIAAAQGEVLIFIDDDRIIPPHFLDAHWAKFSADAGIVTIGPLHSVFTLFHPELFDDPSYCPYLERHRDQIHDRAVPQVFVTADDVLTRLPQILHDWSMSDPWWDEYCMPLLRHYGGDLGACPIQWAIGTTANMGVRKADVERVGMFDDGFTGWGLEDTDLSYRLHKAGLRFTFVPAAVNYHQMHPSNFAAGKAEWGRNYRHFCQKHGTLDSYLFRHWAERTLTFEQIEALLCEARAMAVQDQGDGLEALLATYLNLDP